MAVMLGMGQLSCLPGGAVPSEGMQLSVQLLHSSSLRPLQICYGGHLIKASQELPARGLQVETFQLF